MAEVDISSSDRYLRFPLLTSARHSLEAARIILRDKAVSLILRFCSQTEIANAVVGAIAVTVIEVANGHSPFM